MKKIVGIIAALALASAVFAKPDVTPTVTKWGGNASIEYQIDLDKKAFGMANSEGADFEIQFVGSAEEGTTGDGIWGELKVKIGDAVKVAGGNEAFGVPSASVSTAVIHIIEGDFWLDMDIKAPGLATSGGDINVATWSAKSFPTGSVTLDDKAGFTLKFGLKDGDKSIVDFGLQFADNGVKVAKEKKFAFLFDVTLKAVDNLNFYAGAGFTTQDNKFAASTRVDYKLGISDTMYVKPAVGFALKDDKSKTLNAGVLFGWGKEGQEPNFAKFGAGDDKWDNIPNKCADGVSVYAGVPLAKDAAIEFLAGLYDSTFVPGLKFGAELYAKNIAKFGDGDWAADVAAAYSNTFSDWKLSANFGVEIEKLAGKDVKTGFLWGAGVENASIIDNTTLYVNYAGQHSADISNLAGDKKGVNQNGTIKIGAKITF